MKKILILILLFVGIFGICGASNIGDVSVSFCNNTTGADGKAMNFVAKAGVPYEFCLEILNGGKDVVDVSLGFVDGEITSDVSAKKACSHDGKLFAPYVDFLEKNIVLGSGDVVQKTGFIKFPLGYSGKVNGCLVYNILDTEIGLKKKDSFFDIVLRKANFMDGYVVGDFERVIGLQDGYIDFYYDRKSNSLVFLLKFNNGGILPEYILYTGMLINSLGYQRVVTSSSKIEDNGSGLITFRFNDIPFYKGGYNFSFQGYSVLDTSLDLSYLSDKYKQKVEIFYDKKVVLVPWVLVFGVLGFFVVLFLFRWILKIVLKR